MVEGGVSTTAGSITFTSTITYDEVAVASGYVLGANAKRRELGGTVTNIYLFAPAGGSVTVANAGFEDRGRIVPEFSTAQYMGLEVTWAQFQLLPASRSPRSSRSRPLRMPRNPWRSI